MEFIFGINTNLNENYKEMSDFKEMADLRSHVDK